jgi:hypothetical protein
MKKWLLQPLVLSNPPATRTQKHSYIHRDTYYIYTILSIFKDLNFISSPRQKYQIVETYKNVFRMTSVFFHYTKLALWT